MRRLLAALVVSLLTTAMLLPSAAPAQQRPPETTPVATGTGGAAATVDAVATGAAIDVLRRGGNAVDATVAAAAVLGVTEPYSGGIGGGGFMLIHLADEQRVTTIDSREEAPSAWEPDTLLEDGAPIPFAEAVTSGLSVGVPGTVAGWEEALDRYGSWRLRRTLQPAIRVAQRGFVVDETFAAQTEANRDRFNDFTSTRRYFLRDGRAPRVGSRFRNRDLAQTYRLLARRGPAAFYRGPLARDIVATVTDPPVRRSADRVVRPGLMRSRDLRDYAAPLRPPTRSDFAGHEIYGMGPPSSGGSTVGETLNILDGLEPTSREEAFHFFLEASALSFADRGVYLGDPDFVDVPLQGLLSDGFAAERRALIGDTAATKPVAEGDPYPYEGRVRPDGAGVATSREGTSTTHLTVADDDGTVVSYTFTIEQTGGSGIAVPGRGFLLNNELTDFNFVPGTANSPDGGKRPRSSMAPTIVTRDGAPVLAVGSPGGSTIITTVAQILYDRLGLGATLPQALFAPRASQRNTASVSAEQEFLDSPLLPGLIARGHTFAAGAEIGAATGIELLSDDRFQAVAEVLRRGAGSAMVVDPAE